MTGNAKSGGNTMSKPMIALREDRGVSAVIVAVSIVAIFGAAMLAVDAGNLWHTRRNAVTSTDAGSLRAAQDVALDPTLIGGTDCGPNWLNQLNSNTATAATQPQMSCSAFHPLNTRTGYVTVDGTLRSEAKFGGVLGIGDQRPFSSTSVMFGYVTSILGLRPIGFCNMVDHVQEWLTLQADPTNLTKIAFFNDLPTTEPVNPVTGKISHPGSTTVHGPTDQPYGSAINGHVVHRMWLTKDSSTQCGSNTPGNWGFLDFNGGDNATNELVDWIINGYPGNVSVAPNDCDATQAGNQNCPGSPGFGGGNGKNCDNNNVEPALTCLVGKTFPVLIYDGASGTGSGVAYNPFQFLVVKMWGYDMGNNGTNPDNVYLDLEFINSIVSGICCESNAPNNADTGILGIRICSVDHDVTLASVHCTPT